VSFAHSDSLGPNDPSTTNPISYTRPFLRLPLPIVITDDPVTRAQQEEEPFYATGSYSMKTTLGDHGELPVKALLRFVTLTLPPPSRSRHSESLDQSPVTPSSTDNSSDSLRTAQQQQRQLLPSQIRNTLGLLRWV